jgi:2-succinyl-6-hydroxy-2,4-cyclohexadiene-1-carboxylate synthase
MDVGLLLLHGFTGSPASWSRVTTGSSTGVTVLAPSLVGHGDQAHADIAGFDDEVDRIASLASSTRRWHVAGYSLGGRIALSLLVRHPNLFFGATLIGAQPGLSSESARAERRAADERWCSVLRERPLPEFVAAWEDQPLFHSQRMLPADVLSRQRAERLAQDSAGMVRSLTLTGLGAMPSYWPALPRIQIPTTLMVGAKDEKFTAIAREMASQMPAATLEIVPEVGHNVVLERPEAVQRLLEGALRGEVGR